MMTAVYVLDAAGNCFALLGSDGLLYGAGCNEPKCKYADRDAADTAIAAAKTQHPDLIFEVASPRY